MGLRTFCLAWRELNEWRVAEVCQRLEHDLEILGVAAIEDRLQDICIEKFLEYFWWCWDRLKAKCSDDMPMPSLFHLRLPVKFTDEYGKFLSEKVTLKVPHSPL
ncbi:putative P-type phospholipid transporter [Helianthus annuus]|nr:putative P-type phospholipid transporter [Helianthus annuus]KAJ0869168.1 putative P-type phospholipid transporter [Helianthus annuus]